MRDAVGELAAEPAHPFANGFSADGEPALGKQILDITAANGKAVVGPDSIGPDLGGGSCSLGTWHICWCQHIGGLDE